MTPRGGPHGHQVVSEIAGFFRDGDITVQGQSLAEISSRVVSRLLVRPPAQGPVPLPAHRQEQACKQL